MNTPCYLLPSHTPLKILVYKRKTVTASTKATKPKSAIPTSLTFAASDLGAAVPVVLVEAALAVPAVLAVATELVILADEDGMLVCAEPPAFVDEGLESIAEVPAEPPMVEVARLRVEALGGVSP